MNNTTDIGAIIAAKGTSTRVPDKNIRPFGDTNLLELKINQLLQLDGLGGVYINSESESILDIADKAGATTIVRDPFYSTNEIPMNEVYKNVVEDVPHEHIMFIHITSPLTKVTTLQSCIDIYRKVVTFKYNDYDSLATVTAMHKFMWYEGRPINYEPDKMPHSYDLPDYYVLNFAVNILPKEMLVERKNIIGDKIYPFYLDEVESFDIDNQIEFDIAKTIYESGILDE